MADVVRWVDTQEVGEVAAILERAALSDVLHAAEATWCRDDRTRSSVYTTAETMLAPFAQQAAGPAAGGSSSPAICWGARTRCTCVRRRMTSGGCAGTSRPSRRRCCRTPSPAPPSRGDHSTRRCSSCRTRRRRTSPRCPNSTAWLRRVRRTGYRSSRSGRTWCAVATEPGPRRSSTITGPSCSCPASPIPTRSSTPAGSSATKRPRIRRSRVIRRASARRRRRRRLLPPEALRCLARGRAVLVYGTLPPVRLQLRPWWAQG